MVVFGGDWGWQAKYVWTLSLSEQPTWTRVYVPGPRPVPRGDHTAIYDSARKRMIIFGGIGGSPALRLNDVWALSLVGQPVWTQLDPGGELPLGRERHSAIYDPLGDRMLVFGGRPANTTDETWELSLGPTPMWAKLKPGGTIPIPRHKQIAIYDPLRHRMVIFGGENDVHGHLNDTWALSLSGTPIWNRVPDGVERPIGRGLFCAVYDEADDQMVIFGGYKYDIFHQDAWVLPFAHGSEWAEIKLPGPQERYLHSSVYDPLGSRLLVFGGWDGSQFQNDIWELSMMGELEWSQLQPSGAPPSPRLGHMATYDSKRGRMLIFGGWNDSGRLNDVWELSLLAEHTVIGYSSLAENPAPDGATMSGSFPSMAMAPCGVNSCSPGHRPLPGAGTARSTSGDESG
jgi:hypothetical protein